MPQLINRFEIHTTLLNMIEDAEKQLILISPYIKLHDEYKDALLYKLNKHDLAITVVFGKNEENKSKSISNSDINFFKQFPNITIKYCERLHAKIYANDFQSLVTSMNLHSFSAGHNIEAGILCDFKLIDFLSLGGSIIGLTKESLDQQIYNFSADIIEKYSKTVYEKVPVYEKGLWSKSFVTSEVKIECDDDYRVIEQDDPSHAHIGYCIRTGAKIPFDLKKPYSVDAYKSWAKYGNPDYKEKYCHYSGEVSNGETSLNRPVLKKNWKIA